MAPFLFHSEKCSILLWLTHRWHFDVCPLFVGHGLHFLPVTVVAFEYKYHVGVHDKFVRIVQSNGEKYVFFPSIGFGIVFILMISCAIYLRLTCSFRQRGKHICVDGAPSYSDRGPSCPADMMPTRLRAMCRLGAAHDWLLGAAAAGHGSDGERVLQLA